MKKALLVFIGLMSLASSIYALEVGDNAATFANMDLSGKFRFSKNHVGKDWIIINFFATYCIPCKKEIPELENLLEEFGDKGLQCFILAADKDGNSIVKPYFRKIPTILTILIDRYMVTAKRFSVNSIPTVFPINNKGKIVFKAVGYSKETVEERHAILTEAFSG